MTHRSKHGEKSGDVLISFSARWISWAHTVAAYSAFFGAFVVGVSLHYKKIVQNEHYGYPDEWFPSVSATIGDRYPERSVFQVFIAITSGPRFALVALWYILTRKRESALTKFVVGVGLIRTLTCGGWTYVTSTDDHNWHDIFMVSYLVSTIPWTLGCIAISPPNRKAIKYRKMLGGLFFGMIIPLAYWFIQHKVHKVRGAYTIYAFFEWFVVSLDVAFDTVTVLDFAGLEITIRDVNGVSRGLGGYLQAYAIRASSAHELKSRSLDDSKSQKYDVPVHDIFSITALLDVVTDVFDGFVFWTILTSLGVAIWYFPLWHMGLSGHEVVVMSTISPLLLSFQSVRKFIAQYPRILQLSTLIGLLAYQMKTPEYRLFAVSAGVAASCLNLAVKLGRSHSQPKRLEAHIMSFGVGLILSSIAKFAWWTNNPLWPIMNSETGGYNGVGLIIAVLSILWSVRRTSGTTDISSVPQKGSSTLAALGLGGLLFGLHSLLSDSSTMISWVWEGYPVRGPIAVPYGALTIHAMSVGLVLGLIHEQKFSGWVSYGSGCLGAILLVRYGNWVGYIGGLLLAVYLMSVLPALLKSAARFSPGRTFGLAFLIYNIMVLAHVWVVAYAFVPGGPLMREHTDWVVTVMMLFIGAGIYALQPFEPSSKKSSGRSHSSPTTAKQRSLYFIVIGALQLVAISVACLRFPAYSYTPYHPEEKVITAGIWTIHFFLDNDMWTSERRVRDAIRDMEVDVVGFLESDLQRIIMGNRDVTQYIAEDLGMYVDFGPGPNKHTWGSALLSKFPIVNSTHHLLPSPAGELAPAIHATIDAYGTLVDVFLFHSGQEEDVEDRRLQSEYLAELMRSTNRPSILLSYLVTKPKEGNYNTFVGEKSGMRDVDPSDWDRWCEYILYKGIKRTGYARLSRSTITDTELQVAKFVVGQPEGTDQTISEETVPQGLRFPTVFRGEGIRGHRYHVFDEPRYYA